MILLYRQEAKQEEVDQNFVEKISKFNDSNYF
jgi:hypothetical protein